MDTDQIKISDFTVYHGRNIYSHRPVMKIIVDIGKYNDTPTNEISGFNEELLKAFPGLKDNSCGLGYPGGFLERLETGTYLAHVLEHVILEMQSMLGYDVRYGKTRTLQEPVYYLVYEYENEVCGLECGKASVFILNCFLRGEEVDISGILGFLRKISVEAELGPSTKAIVDEARRRGIPVSRIGNESLIQLGYGKFRRIVESTLTDVTSCIASDISCNKQLTKTILAEHNIPVPYGKVVYSEISAQIAASEIGFPVVLKPFDGNQGKGVSLNLNSAEEVKKAFMEASKFSNGIIVEKYVTGRDFRILVVGDKVSAVAERLPAMVIGDGIHTIEELIHLINQDENRGEDHEKPLTKIRLDKVALSLLEKNRKTPQTVPQDGETVRLRENGNLSTGGVSIDCTDIIHPENAELAILAAKAIGIDIAGIDMVTEDITQSIRDTGGVVVEVNTAPGIRMHLYPSKGKPRKVERDIVDLLFPGEESYRFPLVSVTGTNGKTTTVRLIAHTLSLAGKTVGMTSTSGTFVGTKCLYKGDHSGPRSAKTLLSNPKIDCAVLETARGGILREGLGYDLADVGVVTNIAEDHLGMDGTNTLEDLAYIKSLVTEAVKENGYAVFNGDDSMTPYLIKRTRAKVILFSKTPPTENQIKDLLWVYTEDGFIRSRDRQMITDITEVSQIPITCGGTIECNIENALAAVSALIGLKIPTDVIEKGLKTFEHNVGRFNLYPMRDFKVMLDYGHNLPGYQQVFKACQSMGYTRLVGVIGLPGDRNDEAIQSVGRFCATAFDSIYIKEDQDRRGRKENEVAKLLYDQIRAVSNSQEVRIILDERTALKEAVADARQGDLIVVFYEKLEPLQEYLKSISSDISQPSAVANI